MSILQIFDQTVPLISGYSMRSKYITDSLKQLDIDVKVISSPIFLYRQQDELINNVNYHRCKIDHWKVVKNIPLLKEYMVIQALKKEIQHQCDQNVKLIDAHSSVLNGIASSNFANEQRIPFLYEIRALWEDAAVDQGKTRERSLRYKLTRSLETHVIEKADKITTICDGLKHDIIQRGVKEEKIEVIPNGVDTDIFQPRDPDAALIEQLNLDHCIIFGFIGTFFLFEGLDLLIKAAKEVLIKRKDVKFLLVGSGREEASLKKMVTEMDLSKHFIFTGRVNHDIVQKYYSVVDVLVYPRISKRITEIVTALKPLEAMALKKIVIASNVGGMKELIQDGKTGILFKAGDVSELAQKCLYVLDHLSEVKKMGEEARSYVLKERNWLDISKRYLTIFKELGILT
jgi:PEP-CTERM/exosortase A-associated glycosyltransferase